MSASQNHPRDKVAEKLVSFTGSLRFTDLEPQVLHAIKQRFIDTIGCALAASSAESGIATLEAIEANFAG